MYIFSLNPPPLSLSTFALIVLVYWCLLIGRRYDWSWYSQIDG